MLLVWHDSLTRARENLSADLEFRSEKIQMEITQDIFNLIKAKAVIPH